jgi:hypothetical protein
MVVRIIQEGCQRSARPYLVSGVGVGVEVGVGVGVGVDSVGGERSEFATAAVRSP